MAENSTEGFLPVPEGSIYWKQNYAADKGTGATRPTILLVHAAVADHTLWDAQVDFLTAKGWNCLRFDLFGFGQSNPSKAYLSTPGPKSYNPCTQIEKLRQTVLGPDANLIVIGLSMGANVALEYALAYGAHVAAVGVCAGGPRGFNGANDPAEDALFAEAEALIAKGDVQRAAEMQVRIWGDGPLQPRGRMAPDVSAQMLRWNLDIAARECEKRGGMAFEMGFDGEAAMGRLVEFEGPMLVCWGTFDETFTTESMKAVKAARGGRAVGREFATGHMINLEVPGEFNAFVDGWLQGHELHKAKVKG